MGFQDVAFPSARASFYTTFAKIVPEVQLTLIKTTCFLAGELILIRLKDAAFLLSRTSFYTTCTNVAVDHFKIFCWRQAKACSLLNTFASSHPPFMAAEFHR